MDRLKAMEAFVRIAQAGSLAGAADQLGSSRSLMTKQLQALEAHLGVALFERSTRRLTLTEPGRDYLAFCTRLLAEVEAEERSLSRSQTTLQGSLKIIAPMSFGNLYLGPIVSEFLGAYPGIKTTLILSDVSMSRAEMVASGFDIAIQLAQVADPDATVRRIGEVRWVLCASPDHLAEHGTPESPDDLGRFNCLVHRKVSPGAVWRFEGVGGSRRVHVSGSLVTNSVFAIRSAALAGRGVALLPTYCIEDDLAAGRLVEILNAWPVPRRPVYAVYAQTQFVPTRAKTFVRFLAGRLQPLITETTASGRDTRSSRGMETHLLTGVQDPEIATR